MIITNSSISMQSNSQHFAYNTTYKNVKVNLDAGEIKNLSKEEQDNLVEKRVKSKLNLDDKIKTSVPKDKNNAIINKGQTPFNALAFNLNSNSVGQNQFMQPLPEFKPYDGELSMIEQLIRAFFGQDYALDMNIFNIFSNGNSIMPINQAQYRTEIEFKYNRIEVEHKKSEASFSAKGEVQTADGKKINLELNFHTKSESFKYHAESLSMKAKTVKMVDPLVVNLGCSSFGLKDIKIDFDLDSDGITEKISMPKAQMGFLVLDKNFNGKADDGSELFGTKTGDGFGELAEYDEDKNGWIDENDSVFDKLRLWVFNNNDSRLISLKDAKIGAICLKNAKTEFLLEGKRDTNGKLQKTGIFLKEDGEAGTIHHIDLSI